MLKNNNKKVKKVQKENKLEDNVLENTHQDHQLDLQKDQDLIVQKKS